MNGGGRRQERIAKKENAKCGMVGERENQRVRKRGGGEEGCFLSLSSSLSRANEGREKRGAKEEEEYGKGGFAGKTLHGEGG